MDNEANRIRAGVTALNRRRRTERIPESVRAAVRKYVSRRRREGATWRELSASVGLSTNTLQRCAAEGRGVDDRGALVRVSLRPEVHRTQEARNLVLVTANGLRLEGLGVTEVAELVRALS